MTATKPVSPVYYTVDSIGDAEAHRGQNGGKLPVTITHLYLSGPTTLTLGELAKASGLHDVRATETEPTYARLVEEVRAKLKRAGYRLILSTPGVGYPQVEIRKADR